MRLICCFFTLFLFSQSYASQTYTTENFTVAEIPSWVVPAKPLRFDNIPHAQIRNGVHYLLVDNQVNVPVNSQPSYYTRYADLITNQSGLDQDSQINIGFDPAYQKVILHHVTVIRAGVAIDKLSSARVQILDQEDELENQIYNGEKTINILLEDMRVGDILDYSFTIVGDNPVFANVYSDRYRLQWSVPVADVRLRILWHKQGSLQSKVLNSSLTLNERKLPEAIEYWIEVSDMPVKNAEEDTPDWVNEFATVYVTETEDWHSVIDWGISLFEKAIVKDESITGLARQLSSGATNESDKIKRALQYVQAEIRYVGIELGINSHQAVAASRTLERRYGDCKDKTVLLIALLREMGITANPALVHTRLRHKLLERMPSMSQFNHVIAAVEYKGKTFWLDATRQYQYGEIDEIYQPKFGQALVLSPMNTALKPIPLGDEVTSTVILDRFDVSNKESGEVSYQVRTSYKGLSAERQRRYLENDGLDLIRQDYLKFYKKYYQSIKVIDGPHFDNNDKQATIFMDESYRIHDFWVREKDTGRDTAWVYGSGVDSYLNTPDGDARTQDYKVSYPVRVTQQLWIRLSDRKWSFENELFEEDNTFFKFSRKLNFDAVSNVLRIDFSYLSKVDHVPAIHFAQYKEAVERAVSKNEFGFYRNSKVENTNKLPEKLFDFENNAFEIGLAIYLILWVLMFIWWRIDSKRNPYLNSIAFYPVSISKFISMWVLTFGFYGIFWFYRSWRYVKFDMEESSISPFWRAFFLQFWYYPMYVRIVASMTEQEIALKKLSKGQAVLLSLLFLLAITGSMSDNLYGYLAILVAALIALPLLAMVNRINLNATDAYEQNSRWYPRHGLLMILSVPSFILLLGAEIGLLPGDKVINGDQLWSHDIRFMQRRGVLDPRDEVRYFYSDSFVNIRKDGNGLTDRHVFSYWVSDEGKFTFETIEYSEISNIEVVWSKGSLENTVVEVYRKSGGKTLLFLPKTDAGDRAFVRELKSRWNQKK